MDSASLPQRLARMTRRSAKLQLCAKQLFAAAGSLLLVSCGRESPPVASSGTNDSPDQLLPLITARGHGTNGPQPDLPMYSYQVVHTWPHDRRAFTQGLVFLDGELLESTGWNGESSLRRVELQSGRVLQQVKLPYNIFAEGLAVFGRKLFQLTWQNGKCFVYDLQSFAQQREFTYSGEGWGLTTDGQSLIMSDGSNRLRFIDPDSFVVKKIVAVGAPGRPLNRLNELEYVKGEIFANIWQTAVVARIDPATGKVLGLIDFTGLLSPADRDAYTDVMNGIAYDPAGDRLFVTGKRWPKLFEVRLQRK